MQHGIWRAVVFMRRCGILSPLGFVFTVVVSIRCTRKIVQQIGTSKNLLRFFSQNIVILNILWLLFLFAFFVRNFVQAMQTKNKAEYINSIQSAFFFWESRESNFVGHLTNLKIVSVSLAFRAKLTANRRIFGWICWTLQPGSQKKITKLNRLICGSDYFWLMRCENR